MWLLKLAVGGVASFAVAYLASAEDAETALANALEYGDLSAAYELLEQGIDVNDAQVDGMTALHWAVYRDATDAVERLIAAGADVCAENRYGVTPLALACTNGNSHVVKLLLKSGADSNASLRGGETALMTAARTGKLASVEALLTAGADVAAKEHKGQTALMWAAAEGHADVVDALLGAGADADAATRAGFTPFLFAVREGKTDVCLKLIAAGVDVRSAMRPRTRSAGFPVRGISPLLLAVENGHFSLAVELLKAGADPNDRRSGYAPLHAVTWVRKPIRGDGDPPPRGSGKTTSLEFVRALVAHGADVNLPHGRKRAGRAQLNYTSATPLFLAAQASDVALLRLLVELGAKPHQPNEDKCTPLMAAAGVGALGDGEESAGAEAEAIATVKLLLDLGADIDAVDENGETAMHGAAYQSRATLVQLLAERGADVEIWNRKNNQGWTPLMIAQGHRPGNFRPSPETIDAVLGALQTAGVEDADRPDESGEALGD